MDLSGWNVKSAWRYSLNLSLPGELPNEQTYFDQFWLSRYQKPVTLAFRSVRFVDTDDFYGRVLIPIASIIKSSFVSRGLCPRCSGEAKKDKWRTIGRLKAA
ncbi:hypothetical protein METHB2_60050 [Candidatus Methylobacter favarea]|uniref:Uncharacterized protein n=1 Tax=Candidatus Methylobacter favarea TaxID=2707345 RepID=A0A8S0XTY8_9GAMM|nr:hypothetical protein [Candidatus Methylobacter favarea]CAA9892158.1 hypothetical protein METHB2_60050 [Candidatus Methylobacter favarea]